MNREGSLATLDFPGLLQTLSEQRWTGVLTLSHAGFGRQVVVQGGRMVFASSSNPDERLGELLLRRGKLTLPQFVSAGTSVGPGRRLGQVLVELGALSPSDLIGCVVQHTQEIIYGAFQLTEGHYRLQDSENSSESITLKMSTPDLIVEGIRRIDAWSRVHRGVGGPAALYQRAPGYEAVLRGMNLAPEKVALLTQLEGARSVEQICAGSTLSDFEDCQTLWAYRVIGLVRRTDAEPKPTAFLEEDDGLGSVLPGD